MAAAKTDPAATKSAPKPEVAEISEDEIAQQLIEASFPDLAKEPEVALVPTVEVEPEIINDFYEALGFPYCKKCGERRRTYDGVNASCPIAKPNCSGFSAEPSPISE